MTRFLAALLCAFCLVATPAASAWAAGQPLTQADLKPLAEDDFDAKVKVLNALAAAPAEQAGPILRALQNDALFYAPAAGMLRQEGERYLDAISGQPVAMKADDLQALTLNNALRAQVDSAASGFVLQSPDRAVRAQAIDTLLAHPETASRTVVDAARKQETDPELRTRLHLLWANLALDDGSPAEKLEALRLLAGDTNPQTRQRIAPLLAKDSGADDALRAAARQALDNLAAQARKAELIGNLFAGLSLGSVLLLAALGLAITYGLIGVINMAHGEFLMIGAYATYVVQTLFRNHFPAAFDWYLPAALPAAFLARPSSASCWSAWCCGTCTAGRWRRCSPPSASACC